LTETRLSADLSEAERGYRFRLQKPDFTGQTIPVDGPTAGNHIRLQSAAGLA